MVVLRLPRRADGLPRAAPDAHEQWGAHDRSNSSIRLGKEDQHGCTGAQGLGLRLLSRQEVHDVLLRAGQLPQA
eukprot:4039746-Pyramimonas_sp.AAC.1